MKKLTLANLPTPIEKLEGYSREKKKNIYVKRDDYTGTEMSGNKIRKLEYALAEALARNSDTVITTGAIQSNHCRSTAAACAKLGLECHLILRGEVKKTEGNLFLDQLLGANIHIISPEASREEAMKKLEQKLSKEGKKVYLIPVGASNAIGSFGYRDCMEEILKQEQEMGLFFDRICLAVGSGGTYAGLWGAKAEKNLTKKIVGFSVDESKEVFTQEIIKILQEMDLGIDDFSDIDINDDYIGKGYAQYTEEELAYYFQVAKDTGMILDPCYTGKAFRGMMETMDQWEEKNILFIHTGGLQGWIEEEREIIEKLAKEKGHV